MAETKRKPRQNRKQFTYGKHRINAVHVTVYDPAGSTIPAEVRKQIEDSVWAIACANHLIINIALT